MTTNHQFKEQIRKRMEKTGESYTIARMQLLKRDIGLFLDEFETDQVAAVSRLPAFLREQLETHPFWYVSKQVLLTEARKVAIAIGKSKEPYKEARKALSKVNASPKPLQKTGILKKLLAETLASQISTAAPLEQVAKQAYQKVPEHIFHALYSTFITAMKKHPEALEKAMKLWGLYLEPNRDLANSGLPDRFLHESAMMSANPAARLKKLEEILHKPTIQQGEEKKRIVEERKKLSLIGNAAKAAFETGEKEKALHYAKESLKGLSRFSITWWDTSDIIHHGHMIQGLIAFEKNEIQTAKSELLKAAQITKPLSFDAQPRFDLAQKLLEYGEKDIVIGFLEQCLALKFFLPEKKKVFNEKIEVWISEITAGAIPQFIQRSKKS